VEATAQRRRPPGALDAALVVVLFAAQLIDSEICKNGHGISLTGALAALALTLPLLWRTRAPLLVLALVTVGVFLTLDTLRPADAISLPPMVALYTAASHGDRRRSLLLSLLYVPVPGLTMVLFFDTSFFQAQTVTYGALLVAAVATGDGVRSKRNYHARAESERAAESERRVAEERVRIARDVHDVVAHAMVAINVQAGVAAHVLDRRPEQARTALTEIKRVSGEALSDLRATLGVLRDDDTISAPVRPADSLPQLEALAAPLRAAGIAVDVRVADAAVPAQVGATAYRIVQEALTNVLRHAGARHAEIRVDVRAADVEVEVCDDGAAVPAPGAASDHAAGSGNGLRGMAERAAAIGGVLEAGSRDSGGWRVHAVLPLSAPVDTAR
jgi:signal transduction histidine kinase